MLVCCKYNYVQCRKYHVNLLGFRGLYWQNSEKVYKTIKSYSDWTRTIRTPGFWGYPPLPHDYPYYWPVYIGSQVKTRQSQSYKFKEFAKTSISLILNKTLHATYLLKLLDKMCKYEMDQATIRRYRADMNLSTDGQTDKVKPVYPLQLRWAKV